MSDKLLLEEYEHYIKNLAQNESETLFTNGGKEFASQLMAVLLENTKKEARIFCQGFKPELITTQPYWDALKKYIKDKDKELKVLVETNEYVDEEPIKLLKNERKERGNDTISIRQIKEEDKSMLFNELSGGSILSEELGDNKSKIVTIAKIIFKILFGDIFSIQPSNNQKEERCNFAIFDQDKYRFEYNPEEYRAFGSFNDSISSKRLIKLFDTAFSGATEL